MTSDLGQVHEVPFDTAVNSLPDAERRRAILNWLHDNLLALATSLHWDVAPLEAAYTASIEDSCRFVRSSAAKKSPTRKLSARLKYEIDGSGDAWSSVMVIDSANDTVASSERFDSLASIRAWRDVAKSLRWDGDTITWTPWTDDVAPPEHDWWVGHRGRFPATTSNT